MRLRTCDVFESDDRLIVTINIEIKTEKVMVYKKMKIKKLTLGRWGPQQVSLQRHYLVIVPPSLISKTAPLV